MCVIAFSPKGTDIPTEQQIRQMWQHNPDGAGYAYVNKKGKVVYRKGFMTLRELMKDLEVPERFKNTNFALHFRIGTSGKNDQATCHPFPVSNNFGDLRKTSGEADSVLFHNGVLSQGGIVSPLASDTQDFVIAMYPMFKKYNKSKARDFFIEELIEGSRLLVLYKNNAFKMFGKWEKDGDIWVSNLNYKYSYSWYGSGYYGYTEYGYDCEGNYGPLDDDYYDDYYSHCGYKGDGTNDYDKEEWGNGWNKESGEYKGSKLLAKVINENRLDSKEANDLWQAIINNEYKFVTDAEIDILKQSAESYTRNTMTLAGYVIGYDYGQSVAWLEDTPIELDDDQAELDLQEEE